MTEIRARAFAKLNLGLDVGNRQDDGYHSVATIMQGVSLFDELTLRLEAEGTLRARTNLRYLPEGGKNIAVQAALLFCREAGLPAPGGVIEIKKNIPVCAGLAGGSADAAAVLRALNSFYGTGLSAEELRELGAKLGSDVPFCVSGGTAFCSGRGERVEQLAPAPDCFAVVCKPPFPISTPELFAALDGLKIKHRPDMYALRLALSAGRLPDAARYVYNVFEGALPPRCGEVLKIKTRLLGLGALGASMSGTGSAVFGLFQEERAARRACSALRADYRSCFLTKFLPEENV